MRTEIEKKYLGEIGDVKMCKRVLKEQTSVHDEIPFYKISTFGAEPDTYISNNLFKEYVEKYSFPKKGDILISAAGTIGKTVIFNGKPSYFQDSNIVWIENNENVILNSYLYYFYQTKPWQTTNGSTITRIYNSDLRSIKISFPKSLDVQKKIAAVLSALDDKIELNNQINTELEAMAKTLYDYWFVQFDFPFDFAQSPFDSAQGKTNENGTVTNEHGTVANEDVTVAERSRGYQSSGGKMVFNETLKRAIPDGWEYVEIETLLRKNESAKKVNAKDYLLEGNLPVIDQSTDFIAGFTNDLSYKIIYKDEPAIIFGDHTRILKLINFDFARGADGTQVIYTNNIRMPQYLFFYSLKKIDLSNYGYARHFKFLKSSKILLPSKEQAKLFNDKVEYFYKKIVVNQKQNQELAQLRDWLLPMLMNGQVRVGESDGEALGLVAEEKTEYQKT